jgi:hypothetical protein
MAVFAAGVGVAVVFAEPPPPQELSPMPNAMDKLTMIECRMMLRQNEIERDDAMIPPGDTTVLIQTRATGTRLDSPGA